MTGLQKQGFNIPFGQGLDTKTDVNQVAAGKMIVLDNVIFDSNQLQKRNGFGILTALPNNKQTTLTTLNGNLLATGTSLLAFSADTNAFVNRGTIQPVGLTVQPIVRNSASQSGADAAIAANGLALITFTQSGQSYYQFTDSSNGQIVVAPVLLPNTAVDPRAYVLGQYFVILFKNTVIGTPTLQYIAMPTTAPASPSAAVTVTAQLLTVSTGYDAVVANNQLYMAWNGSDLGGAIRLRVLSSTLLLSTVKTLAGKNGDLISLAADISQTTPTIWLNIWDGATGNGYATAYNQIYTQTLAPTLVISAVMALTELTAIATGNVCTILYQTTNNYSYASIRSDFTSIMSITLLGSVTAATVLARSVGLASKPFYVNSVGYVLLTYNGSYQPTYFLVNFAGQCIAKLANNNGSGYMASQVLPSVKVTGSIATLPYLIKDLLASVNKTQGIANVAGIYSQSGINLAKFNINNTQLSSEIALNLHLTGGFVWQYDAIKPVEHSFHLWPEDLTVTTSGAGGLITAQTYFYAFCYEWTDGQGFLHRSAPSVPLKIVTVGALSSNTINVPTLRLTYKDSSNPVRLVGYRWSTAQQNYYQFTSISAPTLNSTTVDSITILDTLADSAILGNTLLYTTGGVIENTAAPACIDATLFKSRMFVIDAEDPNTLWYSKQVVQGVPVEFSNLQTLYVAPTAGAQGSTGGSSCIFPMDDKLIIFKQGAIYYITGTGPDATGTNNDFSEPVYITGTVGCTNKKSIVLTPQGIMFQSDKGIWLLHRNLSTQYIGADVQAFNSATVVSALTIPGTNGVRFNLSSGQVLNYDYFYNQWGTFSGIPGISSCLYNSLHTYLRSDGAIRQETPGLYLDGTAPVNMSFTTAWLKLSELQGYQRAYFFYFLGNFITPHKLSISMAYDYNPAVTQSTLLTPDQNFSPLYGGDTTYGGSAAYGGNAAVERFRVFFTKQKCESIQISVTETYDASLGVTPGAGFTMSGINLVAATKKGYPVLNASKSVG